MGVFWGGVILIDTFDALDAFFRRPIIDRFDLGVHGDGLLLVWFDTLGSRFSGGQSEPIDWLLPTWKLWKRV